jgi:cysteine desulfurase/selenocysteine lyase
MKRLGVTGTVRASFALYNTLEEVTAFTQAVARVAKMF